MSRCWYVTTDDSEARPVEVTEEILAEIGKVRDGASEFFVVEPEPNDDTDFIQASVWTEGVILRKSYVAEVRVPKDDGFSMWRLRTKRFEEIESAVEAYVAGDFEAGPRWVDVTDEMIGDD